MIYHMESTMKKLLEIIVIAVLLALICVRSGKFFGKEFGFAKTASELFFG